MQELDTQRRIMFVIQKRLHALEGSSEASNRAQLEAGALWELLPLQSYEEFERFDRGVANNNFVSTNLVHGAD